MNLTPGRYSCIVTKPRNGWLFEAGERATPYIGIPLRVTSGPKTDEEVEYKAWISDAAYDRTMANLEEVFGWDGDIVKLAKQLDTGYFVGKPCTITVEEEMYKDKPRNVIKWLNGPDGGGKVMAANRALQLARRLAGQPEEADPAPSAKAPSTPADPDWPEAEKPEDDIPY